MTEQTTRYTAAELREAAEQIRTFFADHVTIGGLSIAQTQLVFRQHADMMEAPSAKRMTSMREELDAAVDLYKTLSAEKNELLRQLMDARQQCEYLLASINQAYNHVRDEQARAIMDDAHDGPKPFFGDSSMRRVAAAMTEERDGKWAAVKTAAAETVKP